MAGVTYVMQPVNMLTIPLNNNDNNLLRNHNYMSTCNLLSPYSDHSSSLLSSSPIFPPNKLPKKHPSEAHTQNTTKTFRNNFDYQSEMFKPRSNDSTPGNKIYSNFVARDNAEDQYSNAKRNFPNMIDRCDNSTPSLDSSSTPHTITSHNSNTVHFFFGEDKIEQYNKAAQLESPKSINKHILSHQQQRLLHQQQLRPLNYPSHSPYVFTPVKMNSPQLVAHQNNFSRSPMSPRLPPSSQFNPPVQQFNQPTMQQTFQADQDLSNCPTQYSLYGNPYHSELPHFFPPQPSLFFQPQHPIFYQHNQLAPFQYQQKHHHSYTLNQPQNLDPTFQANAKTSKDNIHDLMNPEFNVYHHKRHNSLNIASKNRVFKRFSTQRNSLTDEKVSKMQFNQTLRNLDGLEEGDGWAKEDGERSLQPTVEEPHSPAKQQEDAEVEANVSKLTPKALERGHDRTNAGESNEAPVALQAIKPPSKTISTSVASSVDNKNGNDTKCTDAFVIAGDADEGTCVEASNVTADKSLHSGDDKDADRKEEREYSGENNIGRNNNSLNVSNESESDVQMQKCSVGAQQGDDEEKNNSNFQN